MVCQKWTDPVYVQIFGPAAIRSTMDRYQFSTGTAVSSNSNSTGSISAINTVLFASINCQLM